MADDIVLLVTCVCVTSWMWVKATTDPCLTNQCHCSRNQQLPYDDVNCFVPSISSSDETLQALSPSVQSLTFTCTNPRALSFLSASIFEKFPALVSLGIEQCNITRLTSESFRGLTSLTYMSISESVLPQLQTDTFRYLSHLQHLTIVYCNMTIFPDISHITSLQYLNISHNQLRQIEVGSFGTSDDKDDLTGRDWGSSPESQHLLETHSNNSEMRDLLFSIKILDVSFNNFSSTPVSLIDRSPFVEELYLIGLALTRLTFSETASLRNLTILDVRQNYLEAVDFTGLRAATKMKELRLEGAGVPLSCRELSYLINLEELTLHNFGLTDLVWQQLNSTVLARLSLNNNNLSTVDINSLPSLRILHLANNRISQLSNVTFLSQMNLLLVNLSGNMLQSLPPGLFQNNYNIKAVDFSGNQISTLSYASLKGLYALFYLDLRNNLLSYLPYTLFKDQSSMSYLYLADNQLKDFPNLTYMTELYILDITNNQISFIPPENLAGLHRLESIYANNNNLTILHPYLFSDCPNLLQVHLSNNQIASLGTLGTQPQLILLDLDNNQITDFVSESPFVHLASLKYLVLGSNKLTSLKPNMFPLSLVSLFLNGNYIQEIDPRTFTNLPRLVFVSLTGNKNVLSIPQSAVNVFKMNSPKPVFNIERNVLLCDCLLAYLKVISVNKSMFGFSLFYPQFRGLDNAMCYTPARGEEFRPFTEVTLDQFVCNYVYTWCDSLCSCCYDNTSCGCALICPSECKCTFGGSSFVKSYITIDCSSLGLRQMPAGIPSRTVTLYLDGNKLVRLSKENVSHLHDMEELYLNNSAIAFIDNGTFDSMPSLTTLYLNDNLLTTITEHLFGNSNTIKNIYLHNNLITSLAPSAFSGLSSAQRLTLHNNRLTFLTSPLQLSPRLSITLSGNNWWCSCNTSNVIMRAVYEMSQVITDVEKMCCRFYSDSGADSSSDAGLKDDENASDGVIGSMEHQDGQDPADNNSFASLDFGKSCLPVLRFNYDVYCAPKTSNSTMLLPVATTGFNPGFIALIVVTITLLLVAVAVLLVMFKRQEFQALVFAKVGVRILDTKAQLDKEDSGQKVFDAFVSHSSKDAEFVATRLAPALEHPDRKYRLCVHYRDFPVGRNITDTICRAIENSSRTILLLSANFLTSEWCRFEFQTAHHHILSQGCHRLIIILLEDIPEHMLDPDLKVHMKSKTYLKYGDTWFWEKLYFAMPDIKTSDHGNKCLDILQGMRFLAGDDDAAHQDGFQNEEIEVTNDIEGKENLFDLRRRSEIRELQEYENNAVDMTFDCDQKQLEHHVMKEIQNSNRQVRDENFYCIVHDVVECPGNKDSVLNNKYCRPGGVQNSSKAAQSGHLVIDQRCNMDYGDTNVMEHNPVSLRNKMSRLEEGDEQESAYETQRDNKMVSDRRVQTRPATGSSVDNHDSGRNDFICTDHMEESEDDDDDQTCAYYVDDGRT